MRIILATAAWLFATTATMAQLSIPPIPVSQPTDKGVGFGDLYGAVRFDIEKLNPQSQQHWLRSLVQSVFGVKDSGEYLIALELHDDSQTGDDKLVARKIIAHFVRAPDGTMISDILGAFKGTSIGSNKVQNVSLVIFSGDLIPRVPINAHSNAYSIALQVYRSKSVELTNGDMVQSVIDVINVSAGALKFSPLNDSIKTVYGQMRQFGFQIYKAFAQTSVLVVSETKMSFIVANQTSAWPNAIRYEFPFIFDRPVNERICQPNQPKSCFNNSVRIRISFDTYRSEIGNFRGDKFAGPHNWAQWLSQGSIAGKGVIQFLSERDTTKAFVAALAQGRQTTAKFGQSNDISAACDAIVNELKQYFSGPDVGALYWSFLKQYGNALSSTPDGASCQNKYSGVYFEPYGLPATAVAQGAGNASTVSDGTAKSKDGPAVPMKVLETKNGTAEKSRLHMLLGVYPPTDQQ